MTGEEQGPVQPSPDEDLEEVRRRRSVERAQATSDELRDKMRDLASAVADTEDLLADTYETSARLRPHAADRLTEVAREARAFAAHEREEALRRSRDTETGTPS